MDSDDSGMNNPILKLVKNDSFDSYKNEDPNFNMDNNINMVLPNIVVPPLSPPIIPITTNKKYSKELIDKMLFTINDFKRNIQNMMNTTNNMLETINKNKDLLDISINITYRDQKFKINCRPIDKFSEVVEKIKNKINDYKEDEFAFIYNAKKIDLNAQIKNTGLVNNSSVLLIRLKF